MNKKHDTVSDIFVKKMIDYMGEILTKKDITEVWMRSGGSLTRINYAMNILTGRSLIEKISNNIYFISGASISFDIYGLYWKIVRKLIKLHTPSGGIIGGEKSMELHLQNFSIPDILIIYTRDTSLRIKLSDSREVHFRTLVSGEKTGKKSLWRLIVSNSTLLRQPFELEFCSKELALMEALSLRRHEVGIGDNNIHHFLKLFHSKIDREVLGNLARYRYIRPLNRLRVISKNLGYTDVYNMILEVIRDEGGGCYINL
ncbi:hypothetical protein K2X92_05355 [Candidatus Gracilibacteria bacterium]|nr:hypothetical protein [Candidatus Gracilibacteria bacterium]